MKSQLKAGAVLTYISLFLNSAISIIYTPIMLHHLGQSEYGLFSLAGSVVAYFGVLNFGLGSAVIRYTARFKSLEDEARCSNLYGTFCILYTSLSFIALILGTMFTFYSNYLFSYSLSGNEIDKLKVIMGILVINISIGIACDVFNAIVQAHERFVFQKVISIAGVILNPLLVLPFLLAGYGSVSMVIISTLLNLIIVFTNIYYCFRVLKIKITFKKFDRNLFREIIVFSSYLFLNLIIEKIYWSTDQIILGIFSGTIAVSIYTIGSSFSGYFSGFSAAISNVFLSKVSGMVSKEAADKEISDLFIKIGRIQYIIISFALSGFIVFGQTFINLWVGKEYSDAFIIALIIVIPMVIPLIQGMGGIILQAKNMHKFRSIVYFVIAIVNVALSLIFVQWWGAVGCALATGIAFTVGNIFIMNIYYWKKVKIDIPRFWMNIISMSIPMVISIVIGSAMNNIVLFDNWVIFIIKGSVFSFGYLLLIWFAGMNKYEKDLFLVPFKALVNKISKEKLYKVS